MPPGEVPGLIQHTQAFCPTLWPLLVFTSLNYQGIHLQLFSVSLFNCYFLFYFLAILGLNSEIHTC